MMTMKSANFSALLALLAVISYAASASGTSLNTSNGTLRVAIVGAGVAGASTAYHLRSMYGESSTISITIFEAAARVGGRVASVPFPMGGGHSKFEAGSPHFFADDECLMSAVNMLRDYDISGDMSLQNSRFGSVGVWDGRSFTEGPDITSPVRSWSEALQLTMFPTSPLFLHSPWRLRGGTPAVCNMESPSWWQLMRLCWKYGMSPLTLHRAIVLKDERWKHVGHSGFFETVVKELTKAEIPDGIWTESATDYLTHLGISSHFQIDVI
jgi:hypothetical protein